MWSRSPWVATTARSRRWPASARKGTTTASPALKPSNAVPPSTSTAPPAGRERMSASPMPTSSAESRRVPSAGSRRGRVENARTTISATASRRGNRRRASRRTSTKIAGANHAASHARPGRGDRKRPEPERGRPFAQPDERFRGRPEPEAQGLAEQGDVPQQEPAEAEAEHRTGEERRRDRHRHAADHHPAEVPGDDGGSWRVAPPG